jgi:hypothetical protein
MVSMTIIRRQDSNGTKGLLQTGELGYDNYLAGGDNGRVYVGDGEGNVALAKKSEVDALDGRVTAQKQELETHALVMSIALG